MGAIDSSICDRIAADLKAEGVVFHKNVKLSYHPDHNCVFVTSEDEGLQEEDEVLSFPLDQLSVIDLNRMTLVRARLVDLPVFMHNLVKDSNITHKALESILKHNAEGHPLSYDKETLEMFQKIDTEIADLVQSDRTHIEEKIFPAINKALEEAGKPTLTMEQLIEFISTANRGMFVNSAIAKGYFHPVLSLFMKADVSTRMKIDEDTEENKDKPKMLHLYTLDEVPKNSFVVLGDNLINNNIDFFLLEGHMFYQNSTMYSIILNMKEIGFTDDEIFTMRQVLRMTGEMEAPVSFLFRASDSMNVIGKRINAAAASDEDFLNMKKKELLEAGKPVFSDDTTEKSFLLLRKWIVKQQEKINNSGLQLKEDSSFVERQLVANALMKAKMLEHIKTYVDELIPFIRDRQRNPQSEEKAQVA